MNRKMRRAQQAGHKPASGATLQPTAKVDFIDLLLDRGWELLHGGHDEEAMEIASQAVRLKETEQSRAFFVTCVKRWSYFPGAEEMRDVIARALRENWALPGELLGVSNELLKRGPVTGAAIQRAAAAWPQRPSLQDLLPPGGLAAMAQDPILLALLETGRVIGIDVERFLTALRAGLLDAAVSGQGTHDDVLRLCCAMGRQCYINEYVFAVSPGEREQTQALRTEIEQAIGTGSAIRPVAVAMLAAYSALGELPALAKRPLPKSLAGLIEQQISTPAAERKMRDSIARLTPVDDGTSVKVRGQYEDNPYPRWVSLPPPGHKTTFNEMLRQKFPFSNFREISRTSAFDVLIAGCGTGQQPITFSFAFKDARFLAVDLSLSSLCYARIKSRDLGVRNVDYGQADILELGRLNRTFDIVVSSGVLHHLADAGKGWRTLLSLLQPDGCMEVGLYSELARRHIVAAQHWLTERGFTAEPDSLRAGRQELAAAARTDAALDSVLRTVDFYSMSECRDLLLPAQERRYTIPQIRQFLDENNLEFLGFSIDDYTLHQFRSRFSQEREADLNAWHDFETENPDTFRGMYEFWVQKKPAA